MTALVSLEDLKSYLGISASVTEEDFTLNEITLGVSELIRTETQRDLISASYTHYLDGTGETHLYLPERPLTAVSSVRVSGENSPGVLDSSAFDASTAWTVNSDFAVDSVSEDERNQALLYSLRSTWPRGHRNIKVTYTAGYTTLPDDLRLAFFQLAAQMRLARQYGGMIQSKRLGDESYTLFDSEKSLSWVRKTLRKYKKRVI